MTTGTPNPVSGRYRFFRIIIPMMVASDANQDPGRISMWVFFVIIFLFHTTIKKDKQYQKVCVKEKIQDI